MTIGTETGEMIVVEEAVHCLETEIETVISGIEGQSLPTTGTGETITAGLEAQEAAVDCPEGMSTGPTIMGKHRGGEVRVGAGAGAGAEARRGGETLVVLGDRAQRTASPLVWPGKCSGGR